MIDRNSKWDRQELYEKVWQFPLRKLAAEYGGVTMKPRMALTPFRIVILLVSTFVFSMLGVALIAIGVHGPQAMAMIGGFLLLPSVILSRLGVPSGIPFIQSMSVKSILAFIVLQTAYYYALLEVIYLVARGRRRKAPA